MVTPAKPNWIAKGGRCRACKSEVIVGQGLPTHDYHWACSNEACQNNDPGVLMFDDEGPPEWFERTD